MKLQEERRLSLTAIRPKGLVSVHRVGILLFRLTGLAIVTYIQGK